MRSPSSAVFAALLLIGAGSLAHAQTVPTPSANDRLATAKESTITLSPFEVRDDSDNGYTATSALSGGRTDTPLKLTAAAVSVMTSQFLQDVAATDFTTMLQWAMNVVPDNDNTMLVGGGIAIN